MHHLLEEARALMPRMTAWRRTIHAHPELGRTERETQRLVMEALSDLGLRPRACADTGVVCDIRGAGDGPFVALRADMDALPLTEATGLPFASAVPGVMHACGHDMHTAMLLGAAALLVRRADKLKGGVRLLFQPDEEGDGGAQRMIDEGALDGVSRVFGCHVAPESATGRVAVCAGRAYAASNPFDITVMGRGAHGAEPHLGRDAVVAASAIVMELQSLVSRELDPLEPAVITIGRMEAGTARNILADGATLQGILRSFGAERRRQLTQRIESVASMTAEIHGCEAHTRIHWGYAGVINDENETRFVRKCAVELLGRDMVGDDPPTLTTEDFGAFLESVPGSFWHLGVGRGGLCHPLHSPLFDPDEEAMPVGAAMHALIAMSALEERRGEGV
ncbi:MAG: amidohydrolase [Clostridiales bacterium]|nr:amidohydrolase [Clostridiales bacterium]